MKKEILCLIILFTTYRAYDQNLTAFHDYRRYFMIFDDGVTRQIEHLPVQSFQIGGDCIPYVSNSGQFKVYYKGEVQVLSDRVVDKYIATRSLLVYFLYNQLYVFDQGKSQMLSSSVKSYAIGDSLVAFYNENTKVTYVYYNGQLKELERSLVGEPIKDFVAGDNICAYFNNNTKYFKVFYAGELQDVMQSNDQIRYEAGRNIIAYVDEAQNTFHAYYRGQIYDLESFVPKSFKVGDDMIAYIDNLGEFKVFTNGEVKSISLFEPELYEVKDSLVVFSEQGYFKVFYNTETFELENYIPENFQMQESTIAYIDLSGWLKAFTNGQLITVTNDLISSFSVSFNLIYINTTVNTVKIYYNGKLYDTN